MNASMTSSAAAAWPIAAQDDPKAAFVANRAWEIDRALALERSERRAWQVAIASLLLGLIGIGAVFVQGPLRRVVEIPIVVDRMTGGSDDPAAPRGRDHPAAGRPRQAQPRHVRSGA